MIDMFKLQARRFGLLNRFVDIPIDPKSDDEVVKEATQTQNMTFTPTMPFATILSQANVSSGEIICRPCEVIIQASRRASTSSEFLEKVIYGLRNTSSLTGGDPLTQ